MNYGMSTDRLRTETMNLEAAMLFVIAGFFALSAALHLLYLFGVVR